jgi:hypothetical protein
MIFISEKLMNWKTIKIYKNIICTLDGKCKWRKQYKAEEIAKAKIHNSLNHTQM